MIKVYRLFVLSLISLTAVSCAQRACRARHDASIVQRTLSEPKWNDVVDTKTHIVIDAGHGGKDTGTHNVKNGYQEKERTLRTARIVKNYLEEMGYRVTLTRSEDAFIPLNRRAEIANDAKAALFVSLHYNHADSREAHGVEIFYYKDDKNPFAPRILASKQVGEEILSRIKKHTGAHARGVKKANFAVLRETAMPAILIEGGFLSNPGEREKIKDESYLCYLGWAIARGIETYFESKTR